MRKIIVIIMAVALVALPAVAQQQEQWQTSTMQTSGSAYSSQVTPVGTTAAPSMGTTTNNAPGRPGNIRRSGDDDDWGTNPHVGEGDEGSPIGDAFWPLMLFALAYMSLRVFLKRKRA